MPADSPLILLGLGGLLSAFSYSSQWTIPLASWLAPIFLLRFVRTQGRWSLAWIWLVLVLALAVSHRRVIDAPGLLYPALVCLMATPFILENLADLLEETRREAKAGARRGAIPRVENKAVLLTPTGEIAFHYRKNRPLPGQESQWSIRGDGQLRFAESPYGRIAVAICSDLDYPFPPLIRQVGQARADILPVPSSDWEGIKYLHPRQAAFHAIANGVALVRPDRWGVSMSFDRYGRPLAAMDHFTSTERAMVAYIPTRGGPTVYSRLGDWFGWLCGVGLLLVIAIGVRRG